MLKIFFDFLKMDIFDNVQNEKLWTLENDIFYKFFTPKYNDKFYYSYEKMLA